MNSNGDNIWEFSLTYDSSLVGQTYEKYLKMNLLNLAYNAKFWSMTIHG